MQKKILLAQSLLTNPSILILDEPAANLDPTTRKELFDQLIMLRNQGKTIIISSHILAELERLIDEATFIYYGEVVRSGKVSDFKEEKSEVFFKTEDNNKAVHVLTQNGYKVQGDIMNELFIEELSLDESQKIYDMIKAEGINVLSFRTNDLQSLYDKLSKEAFENNSGKQTLSGTSTVQNKEGRSN